MIEKTAKGAGFALFFLALIFWPARAWACPGCADIVGKGREALASFRFFQGINWSVVFMLSVPYLLIGIAFLAFRRAARKNKEKQELFRG